MANVLDRFPHRSRLPMVRALALFLATAALAPASGSARAENTEARAVLAKAVKAQGGEEFLSKNKASRTHVKGKIDLPGVGEVDFEQSLAVMRPDRFRESLDITIGGQKVPITTVVIGDKMSIESNGNPVDVTDRIKEALADAKHLMTVAQLVPVLTDKAFDVSLIGEAKVENKPAVGVRVSSKGHKDVKLFFDKETYLLAKLEHRAKDLETGKEVTEERILLEYKKDADGIPVPTKAVVRRDGKKYMAFEVLEVKFFEKLDDSEFRKLIPGKKKADD